MRMLLRGRRGRLDVVRRRRTRRRGGVARRPGAAGRAVLGNQAGRFARSLVAIPLAAAQTLALLLAQHVLLARHLPQRERALRVVRPVPPPVKAVAHQREAGALVHPLDARGVALDAFCRLGVR